MPHSNHQLVTRHSIQKQNSVPMYRMRRNASIPNSSLLSSVMHMPLQKIHGEQLHSTRRLLRTNSYPTSNMNRDFHMKRMVLFLKLLFDSHYRIMRLFMFFLQTVLPMVFRASQGFVQTNYPGFLHETRGTF